MIRVDVHGVAQQAFGLFEIAHFVEAFAAAIERFRERLKAVQFRFDAAQRLFRRHPPAQQRHGETEMPIGRMQQIPARQGVWRKLQFPQNQADFALMQPVGQFVKADLFMRRFRHRRHHDALGGRQAVPHPLKGVRALF